MKYLYKSFISALICIVGLSISHAQFSLTAELRPRSELRNGYRVPRSADSKSAFFISQRTRLNLSFQNSKIQLFISPQDIRVWGAEKQLGSDPSFSLHESWGLVRLSDKVAVKAGRQELVYDGHRLLGNVNWVQQARSHDALLFKYAHEGFKFDVGSAFNQSAEKVFTTHYRPDNYKALTFLHLQNGSDKVSWNGMIISDANEKSDIDHDLSWRHTIGGGLSYSLKNFNTEGSAYFQTGNTKMDQNISSFLFSVKGQYQFTGFAASAGLDFVSGDDPKDSDYQAFNTLFATNHKFYGFMDYYLNVPVDTKNGGLQDYFVGVDVKASSTSTLKLFYHQFFLANDVINPSTPEEISRGNLGGELDMVFGHKISPFASMNMGFSMYFPNSTTVQIKGGDKDAINTWGWIMLTVNPEIWNSKSQNPQK
ncbi:MAG: alginate export family protein [Saprospiraceae bacterium]|nr:alginate export family protein [Saprospiraceae bacterium]